MYPLRPFLLHIICCTALLLCLLSVRANAQEQEQVYISGRRYLDLNIHALDNYARRLERTQKQLLARLKRKEHRLERRLMHRDSAAYARYQASRTISYDSISKLAATPPDSATLAARLSRNGNKTIDTLKRVYGFVQSKASSLTSAAGSVAGATGMEGYSNQLGSLQSRLSYDQYLSELTSQRTTNLESIAGNDPAVTGMQKQLYYAKSKIAEWKKIADEPTKAEELALEYLQGTKGFNLSNISEGGGIGSGTGGAATGSGGLNAGELEKLGYQTKRSVMAGLQQKYGSSLGSMQTNLTKEVGDWQDKAQSLSGQLKETKQSLQGLRHTEKPKFRINPMRGLPFWKRIEKSWGLQTTRATTDGRPAMLQLSGTAGYRFSEKLSAGLGAVAQIGLGQSWSSIRFTFEGIGARSYVAWQWQYGIGVYGGYERIWKTAAFSNSTNATGVGGSSIETIRHDRAGYSEALLAGITKTYKVNSKWNGAIQLLYDVWWQEKGLRSPLVLRFTTQSK